LWRLRHNTAPLDILAADEPKAVDALPRLVTTGLDPVVHADSFYREPRPMDCRIKSGNDKWNRRSLFCQSTFTDSDEMHRGNDLLYLSPPRGERSSERSERG
jgi:hypothetical protein